MYEGCGPTGPFSTTSLDLDGAILISGEDQALSRILQIMRISMLHACLTTDNRSFVMGFSNSRVNSSGKVTMDSMFIG